MGSGRGSALVKSLYRKYRPLSLTEVVGQEQITTPLSNALKSGKIAHAYLFTGPRGTGKTSVARIFAHEVNGFKYELEDEYVDIVEIDGASNRGIDNIREIREKAAIAPTLGKYKIYIIDEVHMLTKEAFNALLKTLEEPPAHVIFIMATTDVYKVPITITSRAQTYNFKLVDNETVFRHLSEICKKEKIKIDDAALRIVVKRGGGSFRDSLSLLDQISTLSSEEITKEMVEGALGLPEDDKINGLLSSYAAGDATKITAILKDLYNSGTKVEIVAEELISKIIESPAPEILPLLEKLPDVKAPFAEAKLLYTLVGSIKNIDAPRNDLGTQKVIQKPTAQEAPKVIVENTEEVSSSSDFNWGNFVEKVKSLNDAVSLQLKDARWQIKDNKLIIEPAKNFAKIILTKSNNLKILADAAGMVVMVGEKSSEKPAPKSAETAEKPKNSTLTSRISDIMGGEVQEYGGGSPF